MEKQDEEIRWKELLQRNLPEKWKLPKPEAIISITGVCHQFNIKDKFNLKRDLIKAVISTGFWIVTCGTESGAVQFIEDAVNEHIVLKDCHIPIIGILSQRVHDEFKISESEKTFERWKANERKWVKLSSKSTSEALDPNHTQFIFTESSKRKQTGSTATSECREAFENFLSNINTKDKDAECKIKPDETENILPVVLVLIEGGIDPLRTAWSVLNNNNHVIVIKGSGGAANFLASRCHASRESNGDTSDTDMTELMKECFEDDSIFILKEIRRLSKLCLEKDKEEKSRSGFNLITIYSVDDKTAGVDEYIQNAMFDIYKVFYANKMKRITKKSAKEKHCETVIKKQLKLVKQWKRCDIAETEIFISKNRNELSALQTTINKKMMTELRKKMEQLLTYIDNNFKSECDLGLMSMKEQFATCISQVYRGKPSYVKSLPESLQNIKQYLQQNSIHVKPDKQEEYTDVKTKFREIRNTILDECSRDGVSDLLEESLTANRTDLVKLIIDRIDDMQSFVLLYIPLIYQKSIWKSEEVLAIQLIEQQWKKHSAEDKNIVKITNKILVSVDNFIKDLLGDTNFDLYKLITENNEKDKEKPEEIQLAYVEYPFYHLFVWAVLVNWKEMAMIFWKHDTDKTCSALFACAVLNELAEKAHYSNHMDLCIVLRENASDFETLACNVMTEMYRQDRETALKTLVTNVDRYNSTPLAIAYSQNLRTFMAITASQAKLNSIWMGDIALYTSSWRIGMAVFFPMLIIQNIGFITIEKKNVTSKQIKPAEIRCEIINNKSYRLDRFDGKKNKENQDKTPEDRKMNSFLWIVYCVYLPGDISESGGPDVFCGNELGDMEHKECTIDTDHYESDDELNSENESLVEMTDEEMTNAIV
ncbi:unnamed protein product [Mytilus coruscus]|uniref:Uncharacterized protein n=1 Tax=Mytilus coruscus TaxID=42192 RepID=A0A6J8B7L7_MYTCO|nr:unnamed protein product [Mytilus coruscus]